MHNRLFLLLLVGVLAACGFHLRGIGNTVLPQISVQGDGVFAGFMRDYLLSSQSQQGHASSPPIEVNIMGESYNKEILSITNHGRVAEYRLIYQIDYQVSDGHRLLVPRHVLTRDRVLSWNDDALLAKENEENMLVQDMRQDAVQNILWHIDVALKNPSEPGK